MSPHDNDRDDLPGTSPDPSPDALDEPESVAGAQPADPAESAQAAAFAELLDSVIGGKDLPPVMAAEHRELVETAAILRANLRADGSVGSGVSDVVAQVMGQVTGAREGESTDEGRSQDRDSSQGADSGVIDLAARRRRRRRWLSVGTAAVAAAVVLVFALRTPPPRTGSGATAESTLSMIHHSRPADQLIGEIPRERADRASDRLDTIYADRMAGFRDLRFRGGGR